MKFGQLIEYNQENIFLHKLCRKCGYFQNRDQYQTSFFLKKKQTKGKIKWSAAKFQYISIALKLACNENKLSKTFDNAIDPEICSISIF